MPRRPDRDGQLHSTGTSVSGTSGTSIFGESGARGHNSAVKVFVPGMLLAVLLGLTGSCFAASNYAIVSGVVRDAHGTPQMGAVVELLSADAGAIATAFTDDQGRYRLASIIPGQYQIRATAAFLVPVTRANLKLQAGAAAIVNLTMSTLFEAENWLPAQKRRADEPVDDWKWTLRSTANRPLLRLVGSDDDKAPNSSDTEEGHRLGLQGRVTVSGSDGAFGEGGVHQTLILNHTLRNGDNTVMRAEIGDPRPGVPEGASVEMTAGYERRSPLGGSMRMVSSYQSHPELTYGDGTGLQVLQLASAEQLNLGDAVMIDAGTLIQAERLAASRFTSEPFVRVKVKPTSNVMVEYRYATGRTLQSSDDLDDLKPPVGVLSDAAGRPLDAKGSHQEVSITRKLGGERSITVAAYHDEFSNAALEGNGLIDRNDLEELSAGGLGMVTDPTTGAFRLTADGYTGRGVSATLVEPLTSSLSAWVEYDLGTALRSSLEPSFAVSDVQNQIAPHTVQAASVSLRGKIQRTGTSLKAEYRWQPVRTLTQVNAYNADAGEAYVGFYVRQRLWRGRFLPQGLDAVVEATNLLEQGYQPVLAPDGQTLFLAQMPRAFQGGLAFNF
ncbi:carboxypeptidase-like regulatory domain-containing protein [Granulicella mallensis]|uniref:Carboxypeptidase regulatory-like domain-containing protein n=1 Tax=Granulicella mallensis (strain ATCC BAA-1857 / DSM 23137 / MP5ACTX8) TaxID=682795 RepID=G8NRH9_GRAMM|nr:carboxypeptidase-like regulatory domain-containing protein [Granulicella mallensis]AEU37337.1 hypothetical protein AciX8_3034 [Granulicella mallensis MP5ACTX8]